AGANHSLALKTDGSVWTWGGNDYGQLGNGTTCIIQTGANCCSDAPVQVRELSNVAAIAAGSSRSLALKADGTLWAWGNNYSGQLGNGSSISSTTPVQVSGLTDVTAIDAGGGHSLALRTDGTVWTWGANDSGQLGATTTQQCNYLG